MTDRKPILVVKLQDIFMDDEEREEFSKSFEPIRDEYHVLILAPIDQEEEVTLELLSTEEISEESLAKLTETIKQLNGK